MWTFLVMLTSDETPRSRRRLLLAVLLVGMLVGLVALLGLIAAAAIHTLATARNR